MLDSIRVIAEQSGAERSRAEQSGASIYLPAAAQLLYAVGTTGICGWHNCYMRLAQLLYAVIGAGFASAVVCGVTVPPTE